MIKVEKLYAETNQGLDIILHYYPQANDSVSDPRKKFKIRTSEKTPSAVLIPPDTKHAYYRVCDFGECAHALSPMDVAMKEEGFQENRFYELVMQLAARHNVTDELNRSINKPEWKERAPLPKEKDGMAVFKLLPKIPEEHLKVFGPKVTQQHVQQLHWHEAEYVGWVDLKNGKVIERYSTENYPIFMREFLKDDGSIFYKKYEPLNPDKGRRFEYVPKGSKPDVFINGWREILERLELENALQESEEGEDEDGNVVNKHKRIEKIPEAFICSGERDAICCLSMGGQPIWFNSETYDLKDSEYAMIMDKVDVLYNIPDIDETGRRRGALLAMRFLDVKTIWLPDWLMTYRDNRGKPRKDLRDWMELRQSKLDFNNLKIMAMPAKFWESYTNSKSGKIEYSISSVRLYYFLHLNGFRCLKDEKSDTAKYIRIVGNVVTSIHSRDVRKFVREWAEERFLPEAVRNLIAASMKLSESALENLKEVDLDFQDFTPTSQMMFFKRTCMDVSKSGITEYKYGKEPGKCFVWNEDVIDHDVKLLPPQFEITRDGDNFELKINDPDSSPFFGYLINSSRLYWQKEMETRFLESGETPEALQQMQEYKLSHRFCLDGEGLTEKEIKEQYQTLLSKIFVIGYMMHHFKSPSRPWAPVAMDYKIGEQGECNGRSGKSFMFTTLRQFMKSVKLSGRDPKLMDDKHVFEEVTRHTDMVLVDDCSQYLELKLFYDIISSDMTVNPKNNHIFTIPYAESPKFAFSTNYVPTDFDSSSVARSLYVVFSDYYHEKTDSNDYRESRRIADDFGGDLFTETYREEQWNADINILIQCLAFYLSIADTNIKIQPPMDNIMHRKRYQDMGENFQEWVETYFAPGSNHLDTMVVRHSAFDNFRMFSNNQKISMKAFTRKLKAFCDICPWVECYNPEEFRNSQGRIMRFENGNQEDMIYIRSKKEEPAPEIEENIDEEPEEESTFFDNVDDAP